MIAFWMLWSAWLGAIVVGVAIVAERALASWRVPRRILWLVACALIVAFSVGGLTVARAGRSVLASGQGTQLGLPVAAPVTGASRDSLTTRTTAATPVSVARDLWVELFAPLDAPLLALWCVATLALAGRALVLRTVLQRARRRWRAERVDGVDVLVAERTGPAVVGGPTGGIVIPEWLLAYDAPLRSLVVTHECEHLRARDPSILAAARGMVMLFPWNAALWWALSRLRIAVEMDCDARVLAVQPDKRRYGLLLIAIAQSRGQFGNGLAASALGFLRSTELGKRMRAINAPTPQRRYRSVLSATAAALVGLAVGCDTPPPVTPVTPGISGIAFRSPMPTKKEILEWFRANANLFADSAEVEVFDEAAMRRDFGVSKMPELVGGWGAADAAIRREFSVGAPGEKLRGQVRVEMDIDETGRVSRLEAVDAPPLPNGVGGVVAITTDVPPRVLSVDDGSGSNAASVSLKRTVVRVLTPLARFTPAELDGRPVPFKRYVMTFDFDD